MANVLSIVFEAVQTRIEGFAGRRWPCLFIEGF